MLIVAGSLFDLGENFSYGLFLISKTDVLVYAVGFFSTMKTIFFAMNILLAVPVFWYGVTNSLIKKEMLFAAKPIAAF